MMEKLKNLEKDFGLNPVQKILLTTDGSVTKILEALTGDKVRIETVIQKIINADENIAETLEIDEGEEVNFRVVNLMSQERVLVHATSYTPLYRLKDEFKENIMKKDVPIGKIMAKLKIEARREIKDFTVIKADQELADVFKVLPNNLLLKRNYDIIHDHQIMMDITEFFLFDI
ncbi:MAG: chorismate--pyruvate lyase family protein [Candidatus Hydrothermarchaeales archaeon]